MIKSLPKQFGIAFFFVLIMVSQSLIAQVNPVANENAERLIKQYNQGFLTNPTFAEKQIISEYMDRMQKPTRVSKDRILSPNAVTHFSEDFTIPTLNENFDYGGVGDPDLTNVTANWTRHSGATGPEYLTTSLSYAGYPSSGGGSVGFDYTSVANGDVNRTFSPISGDTDVFVSFLVNLDSARTQDYFFHIAPDPMGFSFRGRVRARDNGAGWSLGLSKSSSGVVEDLTVLNFAQTYLVVLKYTISTATTTDDLVTLYLYDTGIPATEPGTPLVTIGPIGAGLSGDISNVGTVAIRQGTNTASGTIDGIRVGSSWAELFPTSTQPPTGWTNVDNGVSGTLWDFANTSGRTITGSFDTDFAIFDADFLGSGPHDASLTSSAIDLTTAGATVLLGYDEQFRDLGSTAITEISSDGVTWTTLNSHAGSVGYPNPPVYTEYDISAYSGQSTVYVRWTYGGGWDWWWAIDNVVVFEPDAFPNPAIAVNPLDAEIDVSAYTTLDWVDGGGAAPTGYRLYFGTDGGGVTLPTSIENNTDLGLVTTYTPASPLTFGTTYYWSLVPYNASGDATGNPIWSFTVVTPLPQPYSENFNAGTAAGWLSTGFFLNTVHGVGGSFSIGKNFWSGSPAAWVQTPLVGPLTASSQLEFSYLITDWPWPGSATVLDADVFNVQVSTDGGTTFTTEFTIDSSSHVTSSSYATVIVPLATYAGQSVIVRWDGQWAAGDYYFDIDDVFLREPPAVVNPAVIVNPLDAATGVSILTTLDWASGGGAPETGYKINFGTDNPPTNIELGTDLGLVTTYTPASPLTYSTTYYWEIIPYNGSGDATGTVVWSFTTEADPTVTTFPYTEAFENAGSIPAGWAQDVANTEDWLFDTFAGHGAGSDHTTGTGYFAWIDDSSPSNAFPSGLVSPPLDLTSLIAPRVSFYYWIGDGWGGPSYLNVDVFNGTFWVDSVTVALTENAAWATVIVDLTPYVSSNTKIRFRGFEDLASFNTDICVDDVVIEEAPACTEPLSLALSNVTSTSADIGWLGATTVEIDYGAAGHTPGTGTIVPAVTTNPFTLGGLTANTAYDVFVRQDCGISGFSVWAGPLSLTTAQIAAILPFSEDFETWPNNWTVVNGTQTNQWWIGTAAVPYAGLNSAYVSADSGLTYGYDGTASSVSHLYRDIAFTGSTGGGYNLTFWWKGDGETVAWDQLRVFLVDPSVLPTPGIELSSGQVGDANYNGQSTYIQAAIVLPDSLTGTTMRLVFQWKNDGSIAGATSVSIDDISVGVVVPGTLSGTITDCFSTNALVGATVNAGSFSTTTDAAGFYEFLTIAPGTYDVTASLFGYSSTTTTGVVVLEALTTTQDMCLNGLLLPPTNLQASVTGQDVNVTWEAPADGMLQWDDGINFTSIGTNGVADFDVASRWSVTDIAPVNGMYLKKVRFYPNEVASTYTIKVWQGADVGSLVLVYSELVASPVIGEMNEVTLATPVLINGAEEFWFGYNVNTTAGFPAGCDAGPQVAGKGNMMFFGGIWQEMADLNPALTYNWNITGSVYNTLAKSESFISLANIDRSSELNNQNDQLDKQYLKNVTFSANFDELKPGYEQIYSEKQSNSGSGVMAAVLTGYNVTRDDTLLVASNIADLFYNDLSVPFGLHSYSVTAVYDAGESGPAGPVNVELIDPSLDTLSVSPQSVSYWTGTTDGITKTDTSEVRCWDTENGWMMFDISAISDSATINKITFHGYVNSTNWPYWSATPLAGVDPLTAAASDLYAAIDTNSANGIAYIYSNEGSGFATGWHSYVMESWANTDLEAALVLDRFAMGMATRDHSATYYVNWDGWNELNVPYLEVEFTVPGGGGSTFSLNVSVLDGWNMVSIPGLHPTDQDVLTWWSGKDPAAAVFGFNGSYSAVTTAAPSEGYWMKHLGANTYNYIDINIVTHDPIPANAGWNLIGGYENIATTSLITTNPPGLVTGPVFGFSGGYSAATILEPGFAYWIKLTAAGDIIIPSTLLGKPGKEPVEYFKEEWGRIIITDNAGRNFVLYAVTENVNLDNYEMPPAPPEGSFDIRFSSNRIAEDINAAIQTIQMSSGVEYPIVVKVENMDIRIQDESGRVLNEIIESGQQITINSQLSKLVVTGELVPEVYALEQNYPNPFNPSTVIEFSLPENASNVRLTIYNALGERVAELVNTTLEAGKYSYQWDATNVATGMYIYELRTNNFVSVKKMMLLK